MKVIVGHLDDHRLVRIGQAGPDDQVAAGHIQFAANLDHPPRTLGGDAERERQVVEIDGSLGLSASTLVPCTHLLPPG